jgi:hypothetical protein
MSLFNPGWQWCHYVPQAGLELTLWPRPALKSVCSPVWSKAHVQPRQALNPLCGSGWPQTHVRICLSLNICLSCHSLAQAGLDFTVQPRMARSSLFRPCLPWTRCVAQAVLELNIRPWLNLSSFFGPGWPWIHCWAQVKSFCGSDQLWTHCAAHSARPDLNSPCRPGILEPMLSLREALNFVSPRLALKSLRTWQSLTVWVGVASNSLCSSGWSWTHLCSLGRPCTHS